MKATNIEDRVQKVTSKGQITLPSAWRKAVGARNVIVRARGKVLTVHPARFEKEGDETIIFNADRDNNGKGIPASTFVAVLEKLVKEDEKIRKVIKKGKSKR